MKEIEEMRYLGSKTMLLGHIEQLTNEYKKGIFCDPFGGIGTVGAFMKRKGFQVITGDILNFAHYFQCVLIVFDDKNNFFHLMQYLHLRSLDELEAYLSNITQSDGWLIQEYALERQFFSTDNASHIQACIECIEKWYTESLINEKERIILLASLIDSFDKIANTAGTYYAYLKNLYRKAKKPFRFSLLHPIEGPVGFAYKMDANDLVRQKKCDILYLDPPYNSRNYARYYHLPENVSMGIVPKPKGKSGVSQFQQKNSAYNGRKATEAFKELIQSADAKCIIFHYTDSGLIDMDEAKTALQKKGSRFEEYYFDCRKYTTIKATMNCKHHIMKVSM